MSQDAGRSGSDSECCDLRSHCIATAMDRQTYMSKFIIMPILLRYQVTGRTKVVSDSCCLPLLFASSFLITLVELVSYSYRLQLLFALSSSYHSCRSCRLPLLFAPSSSYHSCRRCRLPLLFTSSLCYHSCRS